MATSMLEQLRLLHEEIEALEHAAVGVLEDKGRSTKEALVADLKVSAYLTQVQTASSRLLQLYSDSDSSLSETIATMASGPDATLASFYKHLADVHDGHSSSSEAAGDAAPRAASLTAGLDAAAEAAIGLFTSEELYGRHVDMAELFDEWTNLPGVKEQRVETASASGSDAPSPAPTTSRIDYIGYLRDLPSLHTVPVVAARTKGTRQYKKYVASLARYFVGFVSRAHPLVDVEEDILRPYARDFAEGLLSHVRGAGREHAMGSSSDRVGALGASGSTPCSQEWARLVVSGWRVHAGSAGNDDGGGSSNATVPQVLDVSGYASPEDMGAALSPEQVRAQLQARGLKVGGTPEERCARLWSVRSMQPGTYPKRLLAHPAPPAAADDSKHGAGSSAPHPPTSASASVATSAPLYARAIVTVDPSECASALLAAHGIVKHGAAAPSGTEAAALGGQMVLPHDVHGSIVSCFVEDVALRLAGALGDVLAATARRAERRLTRTYAELEAERTMEEEDATRDTAAAKPKDGEAGQGAAGVPGQLLGDDDDDDDDKPIYNPLNLPLGWDGKPIAYWLWKLQGLNIPFSCEICGGATYYGRRNFDRHFQEWRHAQGMRSLGIPNTKHFHDVVSIEDAQRLYVKLRGSLEQEAWHPEAQEEFEDRQGNVLDRRTYEDLARAGLL